MRTAISERLGIEFPLFAFSHCRDVVAAVTNAGGFGVLGAIAYTPEQLDVELTWIDGQVGGKPYGVDVLVPGKVDAAALGGVRAAELIPERHRDFVTHLLAKYGVGGQAQPVGATADEFARRVSAAGATGLIDVALKHPIGLIASALGPPPPEMVARAREAGVPVAALVGTVEHARRQAAGGPGRALAPAPRVGGRRDPAADRAAPRGRGCTSATPRTTDATSRRAPGSTRGRLRGRAPSGAAFKRQGQIQHLPCAAIEHLRQDQGVCSLESIQVAPTPMAYSGDPADESMCQSYDCK